MKTFLSLFICLALFACTSHVKTDEQKQNECTKYVCPMHPDKTSTKQDNCSECGMEMVPEDSVKMDSSVTHSCCNKVQENKS